MITDYTISFTTAKAIPAGGRIEISIEASLLQFSALSEGSSTIQAGLIFTLVNNQRMKIDVIE